MSVYRPKGSRFYQYDFHFNGHRFHGTTKETTKRKAEEHERAVWRQIKDGSAEEKDMTLNVAAAQFFIEVGNESLTTEYQLDNLARLLGKATFLSRIGNAEIGQMVSKRRGERSRRAGKGKFLPVGPSSVNREIQLLRRLINRARDTWGVAVQKIHWKGHMLKEPPPTNRTLSLDEQERLMSEAAPHLVDIIDFALLTGLRRENIVKLDWSQIDMKAREIRFIVKGGKAFVLPINDVLLVFLANKGPKERGRVFTYKGQSITSFKTAWSGAKKRAGVAGLRFHDLRHTVGSRLVQRGINLSIVQDFLAHSDITTTRRYVHHETDAKWKAMDALSAGDSRIIPEVGRKSDAK